jgi:hypothetical protein
VAAVAVGDDPEAGPLVGAADLGHAVLVPVEADRDGALIGREDLLDVAVVAADDVLLLPAVEGVDDRPRALLRLALPGPLLLQLEQVGPGRADDLVAAQAGRPAAPRGASDQTNLGKPGAKEVPTAYPSWTFQPCWT